LLSAFVFGREKEPGAVETANLSTSGVLIELARKHSEAAGLLASEEDQKQAGYFHTLNEILQQPATWLDTCERLIAHAPAIANKLEGVQSLILTGSGSSQFAGECVRLALQQELHLPVAAIAGGALLTHGAAALPPTRPAIVVSLARSGDSPESAGALSLLLATDPGVRSLVITCNRNGALARQYQNDDRVHPILLDDRTNDRSLAMTSSFTNMAVGARFLGFVRRPEAYRDMCARLSGLCSSLLQTHFGALAAVARLPFRRVVFLGSGCRFGAAREAALKMLEMTAGRVSSMPETYLGLRHGPMSFVHPDTLLVCFLSSDPLVRAYESDLIRELNRKQLGIAKLIVGDGVDATLASEQDTILDVPGLAALGDCNVPVLDVVVGQLLAFFRCRHEGLKPDSPSESGVINRVVEGFTVHRRDGAVVL
jgi:tagatose-6-phosphate ketose/aldose isomerase